MISPLAGRRRLITDIRRLREASDLTVEQAARRAGISASTLAEIEDGLIAGHLSALGALLPIYGIADDQAEEFERLTRAASAPGWWQTAQGTVPEASRTLIGFEEEADWEHDFSQSLVPGMLQTAAFAKTVLSVLLPDAAPAQLQGALEVRLRRQQRLAGLVYHTVIAEEALLRPVGGPDVMRAQLTALVEATHRPEVTIQVLERNRGAHAAMGGLFIVAGTNPPEPMGIVYLEGTGWDLVREDPAQVISYQSRFTRLCETALSPEDSRGRLLSLANELKS